MRFYKIMYKVTGGNQLLDVNQILSKAQIDEGMKVADFGCGATGHFVFPTSEAVGKDGRVYAIDILKSALESIEKRVKQENIKNIKIVWSNLEIFNATKIESGSLDIVLLMNTLYQSQKRVEILREAIRMLKKGGKLVIVEWKSTAIPFGPPINERVKMSLLKIRAQKLGLKFEEEFFVGQYHYGLLFIK